jgi:hypothetical protein
MPSRRQEPRHRDFTLDRPQGHNALHQEGSETVRILVPMGMSVSTFPLHCGHAPGDVGDRVAYF